MVAASALRRTVEAVKRGTSGAAFGIVVAAVLVLAGAAGTFIALATGSNSSPTQRTAPLLERGAVADDLTACATLGISPNTSECYLRAILESEAGAGGESVLRASRFAQNPTYGGHFSAVCHEVFQAVGLDHAGRGVVERVGSTDDPCLTGYVHGVLSTVTVDAPDAEVLDSARENCPEVLDEVLCMHMAGHVLVERYPSRSDFPEVIRLCGAGELTLEDFPAGAESEGTAHELYPEAAASFQCVDGAFMEQLTALARTFDRVVDFEAENTATSDDILDDCVALAEFHPMVTSLCLSHAGALLFVTSDYKYDSTISACTYMTDLEIHNGLRRCVAAAMTFVAAYAEYDVATLTEVCSGFEGELQAACAAGADLALRFTRPALTAPVCTALYETPEQCQLDAVPAGTES